MGRTADSSAAAREERREDSTTEAAATSAATTEEALATTEAREERREERASTTAEVTKRSIAKLSAPHRTTTTAWERCTDRVRTTDDRVITASLDLPRTTTATPLSLLLGEMVRFVSVPFPVIL